MDSNNIRDLITELEFLIGESHIKYQIDYDMAKRLKEFGYEPEYDRFSVYGAIRHLERLENSYGSNNNSSASSCD